MDDIIDRPRSRRLASLRPALAFLRPYLRQVVLASVALVVTAGVTLSIGQGMRLVIDQGLGHAQALGEQRAATQDLARLAVLLVQPDDHELAEHERVLAELDKASGSKTVWRELVS